MDTDGDPIANITCSRECFALPLRHFSSIWPSGEGYPALYQHRVEICE
jgi:hypothetical protein